MVQFLNKEQAKQEQKQDDSKDLMVLRLEEKVAEYESTIAAMAVKLMTMERLIAELMRERDERD